MSIARSLCLLSAAALTAQGPAWPPPVEGAFVARDFRFACGDVLPELRLSYRTIGKLVRDERGRAQNAVLILHGTTGSGANFLRPEFAGELFRRGGLLDAERWFVVLPDAIGHGGSSKPSDGLRTRFPRYDYADMVKAQHLLLSEHLGVNRLSEADEPAIWQRTPDGRVVTWIDVGAPAADRLHRAAKLGARVVVWCHKRPDLLRQRCAKETVHRADEIQVVEVPKSLLDALGERLDRNNRWDLSRHDGRVTVVCGGEAIEAVLPSGPLRAAD